MTGPLHPATARQPLKTGKHTAEAVPEGLPRQEFLPPGEGQASRDPGIAETTLINTTQTPVELAPAAIASTHFAPEGVLVDDKGLHVFDNQRVHAIVEALWAHRGMLVGLRSRKENEQSLNPSSLEQESREINSGINRCQQLIREITAE